MKFILIAKCDVCGKGAMVELDTNGKKDGDHYPSWYARVDLKFEEKNNQTMCPKCAEKYDALIKGQEEARMNFK